MGSPRVVPAVVAGLVAALLHAAPAGAGADSVDEIHYSYGETPGSVVVNWRGAATTIEYGPTAAHGFQAVAGAPAILPVDSGGPFREVELTGLAPDTAYHYRISDGADHVLRTAPLGSFRWVDVGDTASTLCKPWVADVHALIARLAPRFVTHGGDISEANVCGAAAVHTYYVDQQAWSLGAAFQPVWGNHEYGSPTAGAPAGTPRDSLANYKGRSELTNPQTLALDTPTRVTAPGCPYTGSVNTCRGEDWGWFRAGGVLFVSYPEMWPGAMADWQPVADALLARAQADPEVDFVITYGHRPAYSSLNTNGWDPAVRSALDALARRYSPAPGRADGKYVLNLAHHVHALEVFGPVHGLTHVTNAGGGQGTVSLPSPAAGSLLRFSHLGVLAGDYDAGAGRLSLRWVCGPKLGTKATCGYGDTVWSTTFPAPAGPAPAPTPAPTGPAPTPAPTPTGPGPTASPTPPGPGPSGTPVPVQEWISNPGLETDLAGWSGRHGPAASVTVGRVTTGARTGRACVRVAAGRGANNLSSGFKDQPRWVRRTVAGTRYTASVWVRPGSVGQQVVVRLREWTSGGAAVTDRTGTLKAVTTGWQQVSVQVKAVKSGGSLSLAVYAKDLDAGEWFLADDLSLTSG
ncbi:purple acid phosphatase family protein [Jidongwangia harbinensis]|uniref:purple acid phosphatase family protein n=1 Tax=Jidongwangia harbinensis TaxID=2878561 RepID=UPI001CD9B8F4|nr:metallophosphoesterase family protein [Jidongwangia harbinensis]MCA2212301.1 metallophosphoesterase family protein [Jidongwangia harbinensis]